MPALQLSEFARSGGLSEVFGAGVMLRKLFVAPLSAEAQSCQRIFPSPARFRQPGHTGGALASAEVSCVVTHGLGELGVSPS